ncbi:Na/Pi cotransporter [Sporanaerobium hydrogeniformans]|uniref:Na/Pi cotransporter n=1 Tax=Sporanaerobium hydrogeniformans TaxID=3072179 RepID=A0AC61DFT7_9FIRM|nr:Na/Pi cotransporter family protein [Sporanaerobium hydrogeniformans]PHV72104.1 Na/Pi cotransporter [Sporanaerobium hydrogeniformans]
MNEISWLSIALGFLGGFGLFLFGMEYMGEGLQKAAGSKMKNLLGVLTNNRFLGVLVGAGITALIQSSSATTVMVVGFVNAGLMSLAQAVGVIMGANIGTTITAWIVALGEWTSFLKPSVLAPLCIVLGVVMTMFAKKQHIKHIGQIVFGFGALFLGLDMMSQAAKPLETLEEVKSLFVVLGDNPLLGILVGALVTAIIQSSSASVGILQALATAALVPWNSAIYIILGQNIGTCITAILSSIGASKNAKRAAMIHFLFNFIGSVVFAIIAFISFKLLVPNLGAVSIEVTQISIVHTVFNVVNTILLFPFAGVLVYLAERIISGGEEELEGELQHLDERIIETPSFAVENAVKEVVRMGNLAEQNVKTAMEALLEKKENKIEEVYKREKIINQLQHGINHYLVKLSNSPISEKEHSIITGLFHTVSDIERVGDHAENIAELAEILIKDDLSLSEIAHQELQEIYEAAVSCFELSLQAHEFGDKTIAKKAMPLEQQVDRLEETFRSRHIKRLAENKCSSVSGVVFLDTISNLERISDHASNIAMTILDENKSLTTEEMTFSV